MNASIIIKCAIAAVAIATCAQAAPQRAASSKKLTGFCGFKAGENKAKMKLVKGDRAFEALAEDLFQVRTPWRNFKNAWLTFSDSGELTGVKAVAIGSNPKTNAIKAELDACCKELAKLGGFKESKEESVDGIRFLAAPGVTVDIQGQEYHMYNPKKESQKQVALFTIDVNWDLVMLRRKPVKVASGSYNAKSGISRREFAEKAFGVKFGEETGNSIKLDAKDDAGFFVPVTRELSSPFLGMTDVFFCTSSSGKLEAIILTSQSEAKSQATQGAVWTRLDNLGGSVSKWLGIAAPTRETFTSVGSTKYSRVASAIKDDGVSVEAVSEQSEQKDTSTSKKKPSVEYVCSQIIMPIEKPQENDLRYTVFHVSHVSEDDVFGNVSAGRYRTWKDVFDIKWPKGSSILYMKPFEMLIVKNTEKNLAEIAKTLADGQKKPEPAK